MHVDTKILYKDQQFHDKKHIMQKSRFYLLMK